MNPYAPHGDPVANTWPAVRSYVTTAKCGIAHKRKQRLLPLLRRCDALFAAKEGAPWRAELHTALGKTGVNALPQCLSCPVGLGNSRDRI